MDGTIIRGDKRPFGSIVLTLIAVAVIFVAGMYFSAQINTAADDIAIELYETKLEVVELVAAVEILNIEVEMHRARSGALESQIQEKDVIINAMQYLNALYETEAE